MLRFLARTGRLRALQSARSGVTSSKACVSGCSMYVNGVYDGVCSQVRFASVASVFSERGKPAHLTGKQSRPGLLRHLSVMGPETWPEHEFSKVANTTLEAIYEGVMDAGEAERFGTDFDAESEDGVVRLYLGENGTYVANTQTPNRQIWLSSPVSGPWRYSWHTDSRTWRSGRDGHALLDLLQSELSEIAGGPVTISDPNTNPE